MILLQHEEIKQAQIYLGGTSWNVNAWWRHESVTGVDIEANMIK